MNWIGLTAAAATFFGVWFGHVAVRKIEYAAKTIWKPAAIFVLVGLALEALSLTNADRLASTALGILGVTVLWDALELARQQKRVRSGHAPANPRNPRHAQILQTCPCATTLDLLKREPVGRAVGHDEAIQLIEQTR